MEPNIPNTPSPSAPPPPPPAVAPDVTLAPESLPAVILRRTRYALTIVLCGIVFLWILWPLLAPPPQYAGVTLLGWPGAVPILGIALLALAMAGCGAAAMFLTHPDTPHTGLYCTLLGLAAVAIRGGPMNLLLSVAERAGTVAATAQRLAFECLIWAALILAVEGLLRELFRRFFVNTTWITRHGMPLEVVGSLAEPYSIGGTRASPAPEESKTPRSPWMTDLTALLLTMGLAVILLSILMQSQDKGQVLFACLASFGVATLGASYAFPKARSYVFWLAVPLTALVGYLVAMRMTPGVYTMRPGIYPGLWPMPLARALPIDYVTAGVPGAILGYYASMKMRMHHLMEVEEAEAGAS